MKSRSDNRFSIKEKQNGDVREKKGNQPEGSKAQGEDGSGDMNE